ncbi:uncharacterized protein LOC124368945 [Homalodisca vitripennis]|uniref:uncharacterized protein LOC124368945 n=1 Tax=Homalodisca vitripennis TaxID=197043 RepID=UPI001EEAFEBF|nr:uncharacterized protein LOC124368945 [Homalodisca vitripennis]
MSSKSNEKMLDGDEKAGPSGVSNPPLAGMRKLDYEEMAIKPSQYAYQRSLNEKLQALANYSACLQKGCKCSAWQTTSFDPRAQEPCMNCSHLYECHKSYKPKKGLQFRPQF